jgi:hypothetical protein
LFSLYEKKERKIEKGPFQRKQPKSKKAKKMQKRGSSNQMARQQEIRDALLDGVLVPAVPARELPAGDARLQQQRVEVLEGLRGRRRRDLGGLRRIYGWGCGWDLEGVQLRDG